jgi:hypothetical protein
MVLTVKVRGIFSVLVRYLGNIARGFIRLFDYSKESHMMVLLMWYSYILVYSKMFRGVY